MCVSVCVSVCVCVCVCVCVSGSLKGSTICGRGGKQKRRRRLCGAERQYLADAGVGRQAASLLVVLLGFVFVLLRNSARQSAAASLRIDTFVSRVHREGRRRRRRRGRAVKGET